MPTRPDFFYHCKPKPEFDIRRLMPAFETNAQARQWRTKRAAILAKGGKQSRSLARKLAACGNEDGPCLSPACPACCRFYRRWLISEVLRLLAEREELLFSTLIMPPRTRRRGKLHTLDLTATLATLKRQLERASIPGLVAIGAADLSLEIDQRTGRPASWQLHVHLVVSGCSKRQLRAALERHYKSTAEVSTPLRSDSEGEKGRARQVSYCFKSLYRRYVRAFDKGEKTSNSYPLRDAELREILRLVDRFSFADLVIAHGVRRIGGELRLSRKGVVEKRRTGGDKLPQNRPFYQG